MSAMRPITMPSITCAQTRRHQPESSQRPATGASVGATAIPPAPGGGADV